jgi:WD40 repeat protein
VIRLCDTHTGRVTATLFHAGVAQAFSPDRHTLASSTQGGLRLWDAISGRLTATLDPIADGVGTAAVFSLDGRTIGTIAWNGRLWLWNVPDP